jgi:hypothetical protein
MIQIISTGRAKCYRVGPGLPLSNAFAAGSEYEFELRQIGERPMYYRLFTPGSDLPYETCSAQTFKRAFEIVSEESAMDDIGPMDGLMGAEVTP